MRLGRVPLYGVCEDYAHRALGVLESAEDWDKGLSCWEFWVGAGGRGIVTRMQVTRRTG